ncbi:MAG: class I SAM-dependent RNA methyltransferase [Spirochaetia bacterium]
MEKHTVTIEKLTFGGDGLARTGGLTVFVPYSAPDDTLKIRLTKKKKNYAFAHIIEVISPSPARREAPCPYFGVCGGCQWQHIVYSQQAAAKKHIVLETMERIAGFAPKVRGTVESEKEFSYRNRVTLHSEGNRLGFYKQKSREIIEIDKCLLITEELNKRLNQTRERGLLKKREVALSIDDDMSSGFTQVNRSINTKIRAEIKQIISAIDSPRVLDLFCGNGNLTKDLAETAGEIQGWDSSPESIAAANDWANRNSHCNYFQGNAEEALKTEFYNKADILILDPPRAGAKELSQKLRSGFQKIIYLSCDPANLARDIKALTEKGYTLEYLQPYDMFPQTYHIETLAVLNKSYLKERNAILQEKSTTG